MDKSQIPNIKYQINSKSQIQKTKQFGGFYYRLKFVICYLFVICVLLFGASIKLFGAFLKRLQSFSLNRLKFVICYLFVICILLFGAFSVSASFNPQINYQAKLTDTSGVAVTDDNYNIQFKLWNDATATSGANLIWTGTCTSTNQISITSGLFSHLLGNCNSLSGIDFNQTLYLGVNIGGTTSPAWDGEMTPRKKIGAVPAAFEADKLDGLDSTSFLRSDAADTATGTLTFAGTLNINNATNTLSSSSYLYFAGGTTYYIDNAANAVLNTLEAATTTLSKKLTVSSGGANITGGLTTDTLISTTSTLGNVTSGTWQGTAIGTGYGGTGQNWSAVATGSIPYFSGTGVMATRAIGSANQVLYSDGSVPQWGTIGAAFITDNSLDWADFSDAMILDASTTINMDTNVANLNFDSGTLFIDAANNRIGIGTASPKERLDIEGTNPRIYLGDATVPGTTTNRLYSISGTLYWNGTDLTAGGSGLWTQTGSDIYYNTGNVGIGTTNPGATLDVNGNIAAKRVDLAKENASAVLGVKTSSDVNYPPGIVYYRTRGTLAAPTAVALNDLTGQFVWYAYDGSAYQPGATMRAYVDGTVSSGIVPTRFAIQTMDTAGNRADRMTIKNNGNVGIGTTSPSARLSVFGSGTTSATTAFNVFDSAGTENVTILNNGNVGIGTASPGVKLQVDGSAYIGGSSGEPIVELYGGTYPAMAFRSSSGTRMAQLISVVESGNGRFIFDAGYDATHKGDIAFRDYMNGNYTMWIQGSTGNVGIGTTNPANILTLPVGSATDPIADAWTTYSTPESKIVLGTADDQTEKYLEKFKDLPVYKWKRTENEQTRLSVLAVTSTPPEILAYDAQGNIQGIDLGGYVGFLHEVVKGQQKEIEELTLRMTTDKLGVIDLLEAPTSSASVTIDSSGNVGIGFDNPSVKFDVAGIVRADDFLTYTQDFTGDALAVIQKAKTRDFKDDRAKLSSDLWQPVDHSSWPEEIINSYILPGPCSQQQELPDTAECIDLQNNTCKVFNRSLSGLVSINTRAIQQLSGKIEEINAQLAGKEDSSGNTVSLDDLSFANTSSTNLALAGSVSWLADLTNVFKDSWNLAVGRLEAIFVKAKRVTTDELVITTNQDDNAENGSSHTSTIGSSKVWQGEDSKKVSNRNLRDTSKIFISFRSDLKGRSWNIGTLHVVRGDDPANNYFTVELSSPAYKDLNFDYWIVQTTLGSEVDHLGSNSSQQASESPQNNQNVPLDDSITKEPENASSTVVSSQGENATSSADGDNGVASSTTSGVQNMATSSNIISDELQQSTSTSPFATQDQNTATSTSASQTMSQDNLASETSKNSSTTPNISPNDTNQSASSSPDLIDQGIDVVKKGQAIDKKIDDLKQALDETNELNFDQATSTKK